MRIACQHISDFVSHLKEDVYLGAVFVDVATVPLSEVTEEINFQASAILNYGDGGQALLQAGEACGRNVRTANGEMAGSIRAAELRAMLEAACAERVLEIRPGILSE